MRNSALPALLSYHVSTMSRSSSQTSMAWQTPLTDVAKVDDENFVRFAALTSIP